MGIIYTQEGHMLKKRIPLGTSDFRTIIRENSYFVDKSLFIKDVVDGNRVLLFARPRRFGKTLNLSMLSYFFDNLEDNSELFTDLKISSEKAIMQKQGKHPVIYLTFKDVKEKTWIECLDGIYKLIYSLIYSFKQVINSESLVNIDITCCHKILSHTANKNDYANSLKALSQALFLYYNNNPVILIDEYDTPIHEGYFNGYYDEVIGFMRNFLGSALKDNKYLEKAVLTGILRVSSESMFSGLNNLTVCSVTVQRGSDKFGFTEDEVAELLKYYDDRFKLEEIRFWFDGYNFGGVEIYNPWSILKSIDMNNLSTHWVNTSGNDLVRELCLKADETVRQDIDFLAQGGSFRKVINDNIVFGDLGNDNNALWSFLLHTGYLRYDNVIEVDVDETGEEIGKTADLTIPNYEIKCMFTIKIIKNWLIPQFNSQQLSKITTNLISGDINVFQDELQQYCLDAISYYDISSNNPEKLYHMFMLGLLSHLKEIYHIKSNREAGLGRCDIMLFPKANSQARRGIIFEFKKVNKKRKETFEQVIKAAKEQITEKKYYRELQSLGYKEIVCITMAFAGKEVRVEVNA